jgi:hypothetical protein
LLLKTFFFNSFLASINILSYLALTIFWASYYLISSSLRNKFFWFFITVILFSIWGFVFNLDGMILVLMTAEFTILLILIMTYLQLYSYFSFFKSETDATVLTILSLICLSFSSSSEHFFYYTSYYKLINHIVASDFYILYHFLFNKNPLLVVFLTLIISFFSLFFILLYFNLKLSKLNIVQQLSSILFLRKQILIKQTTFLAIALNFQH